MKRGTIGTAGALSALIVLFQFLLPATAAENAATSANPIPDPAAEWDILWHEMMIDITIIGVLFGVVAIYWMYKYRTDDLDEVGNPPKLISAKALGWALIPAFIFAADDFYLAAKGWTVWSIYRKVPKDAYEIKVKAYQWGWEFDYGDGVTSDVMRVPEEKPVVLRMTSDDVIHSFFLPKYRVKEDVMPGRVTHLWFLPHKGDKTIVVCTEYCGIGHSTMPADVIAVPEKELADWIASEKAEEE